MTRKSENPTLRTVRIVRRLLRMQFFHMMRKYFITIPLLEECLPIGASATHQAPGSFPVFQQHSLIQVSSARRMMRRPGIMGNHDDRFSEFLIQPLEEIHDLLSRVSIQVSRGLVGEEECRIGDNGSRNGNPLLLTSGELAGIMLHPVLQADQTQSRLDVIVPLRLAQPGEQERQLHVFKSREHGNQVEGLKNKSDVVVAPMGQLAIGHRCDPDTIHLDFPGGRPIDTGDDVQERSFAGPRGSHQGQKFTFRNVERAFLQRHHFFVVAFEHFAQVRDSHQCIRHEHASNLDDESRKVPCVALRSHRALGTTVVCQLCFTVTFSPSVIPSRPRTISCSPPTSPETTSICPPEFLAGLDALTRGPPIFDQVDRGGALKVGDRRFGNQDPIFN